VSAEEAYELRRGYLGEDDDFMMGNLSLLAVALKAQDEYEEAEVIHRQALGLREQGKPHRVSSGSQLFFTHC
jgi:hypothetical protein